jgi:hypothetical protein
MLKKININEDLPFQNLTKAMRYKHIKCILKFNNGVLYEGNEGGGLRLCQNTKPLKINNKYLAIQINNDIDPIKVRNNIKKGIKLFKIYTILPILICLSYIILFLTFYDFSAEIEINISRIPLFLTILVSSFISIIIIMSYIELELHSLTLSKDSLGVIVNYDIDLRDF